MTLTDADIAEADARGNVQRNAAHAAAARLDRHRGRIIVRLNTGVEVTFPTKLAQGLAGASPDDLAQIEISPSGLGLHWPQLDADLYVPALLQGMLGNKSWMAQQMGTSGGRAKSEAKAEAARVNGRKGGRPRHSA